MNRSDYPPLDDWKDGTPDAWDYEAVLKENGVVVEWCDTLIDGEGKEHPADEFAGWGFCWKHGAIHIGRTTEIIARKAAALFVSLWLRGVSASFCDKIMAGLIWFWELQERPERVDSPGPLDLARLFHETYERLAPSFGYQTRPETRTFDPESPNGRLMIAVCGEVMARLGLVTEAGTGAVLSRKEANVVGVMAGRLTEIDRLYDDERALTDRLRQKCDLHYGWVQSLCQTCGLAAGTPRIDQGLAAGLHCDKCWRDLIADARKKSW